MIPGIKPMTVVQHGRSGRFLQMTMTENHRL
jgi:hypothetical protein